MTSTLARSMLAGVILVVAVAMAIAFDRVALSVVVLVGYAGFFALFRWLDGRRARTGTDPTA